MKDSRMRMSYASTFYCKPKVARYDFLRRKLPFPLLFYVVYIYIYIHAYSSSCFLVQRGDQVRGRRQAKLQAIFFKRGM